MNLFSIFLVALGLAMDAFAVSITSGMLIPNLKKKHAAKIAFAFGFAQALMPLIGFIVGINFKDYIARIDHWIAFVLLGFLGVKMILEGREQCQEKEAFNPLKTKVLLMLSIATSIDALIIGISFAFLDVSITKAVLIIGIITFIICFIGVLIGKKCNCIFRSRAEYLGGAILILMGIKILFEHLDISLSSIISLFT